MNTILFQLSDIHINNNNYRHDEYQQVFNNLYNEIKKYNDGKNELITVICGDLFNSKIHSNAYSITVANDFIQNLIKYSKLIIILGNHDYDEMGNINNILFNSPVICSTKNVKNNDKIYLLTEDGEYNNISVNNKISFVLTTREATNIYKFDKKDNHMYIALYHGCITISKTNYSKYQISDFNDYDLILLGDTHKMICLNNKMAYCGSLLQLNFSEGNKHGIFKYLINNNKLNTREFIEIYNEYCYITFNIKNNTYNLINDDITVNALKNKKISARLFINTNETILLKTIEEKLRQDFNIISFNYIIKENKKMETIELNDNNIFEIIDNTNKNIYSNEQIIKCLNIRKELLDEKNVNNKMKNIEIIKISFKNITCYGDNNVISFDKFDGICSILGSNTHGKTSILDIILYSIFNKSPRNNSILSDNFNDAKIEVVAMVNKIIYRITRSIIKIKRKDERITYEHPVKLEIMKNGIYENITSSIVETNKIIDMNFGEYSKILKNNIMIHENYFSFTNETMKERELLLNDVFNLDTCKEIIKIAEKKIRDSLKTIKNENQKIDNYLNDPEILILYNNIKMVEQEKIDKLKEIQEQKNQEIEKIGIERDNTIIKLNKILNDENKYEQIKNKSHIDYENLIIQKENELIEITNKLNNYINNEDTTIQEELNELTLNITNIDNKINKLNVKNDNLKENLINPNKQLISLNIEEIENEYTTNKELINNFNYEILFTLEEYKEKQKQNQININTLKNLEKQYNFLLNCNYNNECNNCSNNKTILQNVEHYKTIQKLKKEINENVNINEIINILELKNKNKIVKKQINEYYENEQINEEYTEIKNNIKINNEKINNLIDKKNTLIEEQQNKQKIIYKQIKQQNEKLKDITIQNDLKNEIQKLKIKNEEYIKIKNKIDNYTNLLTEKNKLMLEIQKLNSNIKNINIFINKISAIFTLINESRKIIDENNNIVQTNDIIKKYYNVDSLYDNIFKEIELIANNFMREISDCELTLSKNKDGIELHKKYKNQITGEIEYTDAYSFSSSEKFIANIALRIALCKLNKNWKYNFFIIDEGFTVISSDRLHIIPKIIENLKKNFKWVLLISHLDSVKNTYDNTFEIKRINGKSLLQIK